MAFGFSPKHHQDLPLEGLDHEHFLVLATEAAQKLGWNVSFASEQGFVAYTKFSWSSWSEEVTLKLDDEIASIKSECTGSQLIDWGKNKQNVQTLIKTFAEVRDLITAEELESKRIALRQSYGAKKEDVLSQPSLTAKEKITNVFSIFKPTENYFITPILININILLFVAMVVSGVNILLPENESLISWGANFRPVTLEGEWWRLFTSCFLHIGIIHLLMNMYALLYIGLLLEPYLGKARFLAAYVLAGVSASLCSLWWHDLTISAGASGAIFGMYGVFLALLTTRLLDQSVKKALLTSVSVFVGYNLLNGLQEEIDNAAHIGGLLSGVLIGYAFIPSLKRFGSVNFKLSTIGILAGLTFLSSFSVYQNLPNDIGRYDAQMQSFVTMEEMALSIYSLPEDTPKEKYLSEIRDSGIYYWNENLKLIESLEELDLPQEIKRRNKKLKAYCELRIKSYELIYKSISEETEVYTVEINTYNQQIEAIINELMGN